MCMNCLANCSENVQSNTFRNLNYHQTCSWDSKILKLMVTKITLITTVKYA